ncbi:hypothetical protein NP233_g1438 [Leucocoprinus birnbaumii]|uniref:Uncharacterized protein n=1 Tax=Leucocoprinus birnbaumii TaxID=56174 RepID=A0AAD5VZX1_9AGAR|nr:hypothetical protein NP233_g1438 [Leucocoprinus birnbaumii]
MAQRIPPHAPVTKTIALPSASPGMEDILHPVLRATEDVRAVAPYMIGARSSYNRFGLTEASRIHLANVPNHIHFPSNHEIATNPPVTRMCIQTNRGELLLIIPRNGPYVTVQGVRESVVAYMQASRDSLPPQYTMQYSQAGIVNDPLTAAPVAIEYWVWRGLVQIGMSIEDWSLEMGF